MLLILTLLEIFISIVILSYLIKSKILRKREASSSQEVAQCFLADSDIDKFSQYFISREEKYISSLGNGYIMNFFAGGNLRRGFAVISNKRVYFRGSCFSGRGKSLVKTDEERTIDIKDVTGSGFIYWRHLGKLLGLLAALVVLCFGSVKIVPIVGDQFSRYQQNKERLESMMRDDEWVVEKRGNGYYECTRHRDGRRTTIGLSVSPLFVVFWGGLLCLLLTFLISCFTVFLSYLKKRKTLFQIQYAGGCIAFDVSYYAKAEIDDFQKQLRRTKDLAEESTPKITVAESPVQPSTQNSVPDELRKYADLLKEGLISQEEYDAMKKKILNL